MNPRILSNVECRLSEIRRNLPFMLNRYPLSREDREDISQEVLLQSYSLLRDGIDRGELQLKDLPDSKLIWTIVKRRWVDLVRRSKDPARNALTNQFDAPEEESAFGLAETATESVHSNAAVNPADEAQRKERTAHLHSRLTPDHLALLTDVVDGWTDSDIALNQNLPVKIVKSRIQDMKRKCRTILNAYDKKLE